MNNKIDRKYFPIIIVGLVIAYLIRNAYAMYLDLSSLEDIRATKVIIQVLYDIFEYGIISALVAYLISSIVFSIGVRRYVRYMTRSDFASQTLFLVAIVNVVLGIINIFSLFATKISGIISAIEPLIYFVVLVSYYFAIMSKKYSFNPVEKSNAFRVWMGAYVVIQGLEILLVDGAYLILANYSTDLLAAYGYSFSMSEFQEIITIVTIALYAVCVLVYFILTYVLKSKASGFQSPDGRENYNIRINFAAPNQEKKDEESNKEKKDNDDINDIFDL